jgi:uncharacterized protein (TIGR03067 family)
MKVMRGLLCVLALVLLGADGKKPELKGDLKKLQGAWQATSLNYNGDDVPTDGKGKVKLTFKGDTASVQAGKRVTDDYAKIQVKLDSATKPPCIDISISAGAQKGATLEGIYKLEEDKLTLCVKVLGMERPTKFESPEGQSIALIVFERVK